MWYVLRQRNFALLWWGGLISFIGDWMLRIALPAYVYNLTGSTLATGAMFIVGTLPNLLFGSVAGVFVDRWDRQRTLVIANVLLAVGLLPLLVIGSTEWLWLVYVVAFVASMLGLFVGPAEHALLPKLVPEEYLLSANSLNALNNNLARLIGPALGGFVAVRYGLVGVALIDAGTYLCAALMIALIRFTQAPEEPAVATTPTSTTLSLSAVWREWIAGLRIVRHEPMIRILFVVTALMALGEGVLAVLFVPFVTEVLKGEALELGWLMSAQAIGGLLGSFVVSAGGQRVSAARLLGPSAIIFGLIDLAIFNYPRIWPHFEIALVLFILVGLPGAGIGASMSTLMQSVVADKYRGRIFGAYGTTFALLTLVGMLFASVLGKQLGIVVVISVQGFAYVLAGVIALSFRRSRYTHPVGQDPITTT